jgi:hypothetical protein
MSSEDVMRALVQNLKALRNINIPGNKPIFWLGAGCSVFDGIPLNDGLLEATGCNNPSVWGSPQFQFDNLIEDKNAAFRAKLFEPHFNKTIKPDSPYHGLVRLLLAEYADLVFTFNIDDLLEQALQATGLSAGQDYLVIKIPEIRVNAAIDQIRSGASPRIRIVKLHGDYKWGFNYMTSSEIVGYENEIKKVVNHYSSRWAIVCGYSFFHLNVLNAFSTTGDPLYYINKFFPSTPMVLSLVNSRSKKPTFVNEPLGCFETFIEFLVSELI